MRLRLSILAILALLWPAITPAAGASAVVRVAEDGGFPPDTVRTIRSLAESELRARGVEVGEEAPAPGREFVLRLGRLDKKVLITLEDLAPPRTTPDFAATHAASSIDEADTVVPRLVRSVLNREPFEKGARMTTVTAQESAPYRNRPGEGLFVIGVGLAPLGGSIGWSYETRAWRLGILAQGADDGASFFGVEGAWIPFEASLSPYVGAGLGSVGGDFDASLGTKLEAGVEFFRLNRVRLMAGVSAIIPFEVHPGQDRVSWGLSLRCGF
ncbi:MAG TPA: hypothetical protein VLF95_00440 [Vicinamibacteria bacterium]|nr:hypothetical protein [Vicinamibacteria bacterium]